MRFFLLQVLCIFSMFSCSMKTPSKLDLSSPDDRIQLTVNVTDEGKLYYRASFKKEVIIDTSFLGFDLKGMEDLVDGFQIISNNYSKFDETWEQPWGEERLIRNHYNELKVALQEKSGLKRTLNLTFRAFDDGIAFRYEFPEQEHIHNLEIVNEISQFNLTNNPTSWWIPAFEPNRYEYLYNKTPLKEIKIAHTPATFQSASGVNIAIHEAALINYSSMTLEQKEGTPLACKLVPYSITENTASFLATPGKTPWRTIQMADSPAGLLNSHMILNLNEPNALGDVSWLKAGKYVGIWWEMHIEAGTWARGDKHSANTKNTKKDS